MPLTEVDAQIRHAKDAPIERGADASGKYCAATRLPLPLRRLAWAVGLNFGTPARQLFRQLRGDFGGRLRRRRAACAQSRARLSSAYGVVNADQTIDVVIRWDHRITDAALIAKVLTRLEQVLNGEIAAELRGQRQQSEPKPVRAVAT